MNTAIVTYTGRAFDYVDILSADIHIEDIAHSLSMICRYGGHTRLFYSVAEHCYRASWMYPPDPLAALLHDAAEAYLGDIPTPQKEHLGWFSNGTFQSFRSVEDLAIDRIGECLGIPGLLERVKTAEVKRVDKVLMATEIRDLMPCHEYYGLWTAGLQPLQTVIGPVYPAHAEMLFLDRFGDLMGNRGVSTGGELVTIDE